MTANKRPCVNAQDFIEAYYKECRPRESETKKGRTEAESRRLHGQPKADPLEVSDEEFTDLFMVQQVPKNKLMKQLHWGQARFNERVKRLGLVREPGAKFRKERRERMQARFDAIDEELFRKLYIDQKWRLMDVAEYFHMGMHDAERYRRMKNISKPGENGTPKGAPRRKKK